MSDSILFEQGMYGHPEPVSRDPRDYTIHLFIDYGTTNLAVGCQIASKGSKLDPEDTVVLRLQREQEEVPQIVGFMGLPGDILVKWGRELRELLSAGTWSSRNAILLPRLKVCLFDQDQAKIASRALGHLGEGLDHLWAIGAHLRQVRLAALSAMERYYAASPTPVTPGQLAEMEILTTFGVPEMATPSTNRALQATLRDAGFRCVRLVSESEAAGAWHTFKHKLLLEKTQRTSMPPFKAGDELLVGDAGGWTYDASVYRVVGSLTDGADIAMEYTGRSSSGAFGSEKSLTLACIAYAKQQGEFQDGTFEATLQRLHVSEIEFERIVGDKFESYKADSDRDQPRLIAVGGVSGAIGAQHYLQFEVTPELMRTWLQEAFRGIRSVNDGLFAERQRVKFMTLCGGFFRNPYLVEQMKMHYQPLDIFVSDVGKDNIGYGDLSVVRGMGARDIPAQIQTAIPFGFGVKRDEPLDIDRDHGDITKAERDAETSPKLYRSEYDGHLHADDRWVPLLHPGRLPTVGKPVETVGDWQEFLLSECEPELVTQVYWTDQVIAKHEPVFRYEPIKHLRPELQEWGPEITKQIDDVTDYELVEPKTVQATADNIRYRVWARIQVIVEGLNVSIEFNVAPPEWRPFRNKRRRFQAPPKARWISLGLDSLHEDSHLSYIQRREVPSEPPGLGRSATLPQRVGSLLALNNDRPTETLAVSTFGNANINGFLGAVDGGSTSSDASYSAGGRASGDRRPKPRARKSRPYELGPRKRFRSSA